MTTFLILKALSMLIYFCIYTQSLFFYIFLLSEINKDHLIKIQ